MRKISVLSQPHLHLESVSLPLRWDDPGEDCRWPNTELGLSLILAIDNTCPSSTGWWCVRCAMGAQIAASAVDASSEKDSCPTGGGN